MSSPSAVAGPLGDPPPGARALARGITATWWYTVTAVVFIELFLVFAWALRVLATPVDPIATVVVGAGGIVWLVSTMVLLSAYRHRVENGPGFPWARIAVPLLVAVAYGAAAGLAADSWLFGVMPLAQSVVLLNWQRGVRVRVVGLATLVMIGFAFVDGARGALGVGIPEWIPTLYAIVIPAMSVSSLWWWDVLVTLDRARASEARLAATQERLRIATDVHDLQGHHLQVIALQLELAERLMARDPDGALDQLRAARASVDDARQGTRDLATRFRSVPLGDEVANARDLLSAAGISVDAEIAADAGEAPASALGPVIRETTTNVLRHGAGRRARLTFARADGGWRYEVVNDVDPSARREHTGSGLDGVKRRIAEVGGTLEVRDEGDEFAVVVTVPASDGVQGGRR
ncbi:sensor histidine kinase [Microbacterium hydrocarbonoxydans]|uniref:sensor histidine kinase n=1 Tax=Microbacterium hydrocarbonoxydans TaxID=273678 RepID=UPI00203FCA8E|nr:histidine kinase [Microbacterium hydrocarbonoxydans]MCM3781153.1 histidine kinase [Microbacterium hydrocarbonoxydans]